MAVLSKFDIPTHSDFFACVCPEYAHGCTPTCHPRHVCAVVVDITLQLHVNPKYHICLQSDLDHWPISLTIDCFQDIIKFNTVNPHLSEPHLSELSLYEHIFPGPKCELSYDSYIQISENSLSEWDKRVDCTKFRDLMSDGTLVRVLTDTHRQTRQFLINYLDHWHGRQ